MAQLTFSAWFYWDPDRILINVPIVDRPIAWYGFFFVLGFVIAYFLILPVFTRKLRHSKSLYASDITNWPAFIELVTMAKPQDPLYALKQQLGDQSANSENLLNAMRQLDHPRSYWEALLPNIFKPTRDVSLFLADRLTWYIIAGTIIGARLGHVFFYEWPRYQNNLLDIFKIWEGGLASHGGTFAVLLTVFVYQQKYSKMYPELSFITFIDMLCIPTGIVCFFIRLGNFFNQEILGTVTTLPWAVVFGHPADGSLPAPRHPVQLYEGLFLIGVFVLMTALWYFKFERLRPGIISGWFFILVFGSRIYFESFKETQSLMRDESFIQTGQLLSIPFVLFGIFLLVWPKISSKKSKLLTNYCF